MCVYACGSKKTQKRPLRVEISRQIMRNRFRGESLENLFDEEDTQDAVSRVRIGITGTDTEFARFGTLRSCDSDLSLELLDRSELKRKKDQWLPEGHLHLFLCLEDLSESSATGTSLQRPLKRGIRQMQQDLKDILQNGNISDIVLRVDDQEFNAHRCILAARSPVFSAMLMHDTQEKNTGVVIIEDIESGIFHNFLKYLYTGSVEYITSETAQKLYVTADKYQVQELKEACLDHMLRNISVDKFCDQLTLSLLHEEKDLTDACYRFFEKNSQEVVKTSNWGLFLAENPIIGNELYTKTN